MGVYVRTLTINDLDKIIELENACFPEAERGTLEKFRYRLTVCGELCHGLFTLTKPHPDTPQGVSDFKPKEILVGMIIATKSTTPLITDASMRVPSKLEPATSTLPGTSLTDTASQTTDPAPPSTAETTAAPEGAKGESQEPEGHIEAGETICIHSLCVSPSYRNNNYSQILLKDYINRMRDAGVSKRLALICHQEITGVYTKCGFRTRGTSKVTHGGGNWIDMVYEYGTPIGKGGFRRG
ncbi:hypothetical protein ABW19_dt0200107 [Dactylella cylindrospora]|nr:hypothetical protein ABW19_dt0200107 [Dactylella cylindrospora]